VRAQPAHEVEDVGIPPHPGREAFEASKRLFGVRVAGLAADVPIDAVGVGPVGLDGDGPESLFDDQALRQDRPFPVELVSAVGGLPDQDERAVSDAFEDGIVIVEGSCERFYRST
jgi:hypothetical protein